MTVAEKRLQQVNPFKKIRVDLSDCKKLIERLTGNNNDRSGKKRGSTADAIKKRVRKTTGTNT